MLDIKILKIYCGLIDFTIFDKRGLKTGRIKERVLRSYVKERNDNVAIWQFQCNIIPLRKEIDQLSHDEMISWKNMSQPTITIDFLGHEKGWSTDIVQYGKLDGTCIELFYDEDKLDEIVCRLDLRTLVKTDLIQIVRYVQRIGACFLVDDKIYPAELTAITEVIRQSEANRYCKSPIEYFRTNAK